MNHFSKKLQVVYFLTMMVFVLKKQSEVNFSLVCRVGFFGGGSIFLQKDTTKKTARKWLEDQIKREGLEL